jgi:hypothetical protein
LDVSTASGHEQEVNVMRHHNSVFHAITKQIPWSEFDRLVDEHRADYRVRELNSKGHLLALLFGQLSGADSLRAIETGLASHAAGLYHLGASRAARSTLSDANAVRPWRLFADLFGLMAAQASRATRRHMRDAVRILDATEVALSGPGAEWSRFSDEHSAAKLHLVYDPDLAVPVKARITSARVNDITPAKAMEIEPGTTYVFDLAYYDYAWWTRLDAAGCRFVTRLKRNTRLRRAVSRPVPEQARQGAGIRAERIGYLPERLAASRRNPFHKPLREITVTLETGKTIRVATNDLDAPADEIAALYRQRWQIELFFKWIKQNLKIKRFLGKSHNAVAIQIFAALIAYLILRAAHQTQDAVKNGLTFTRLVRLNLMHKRSIHNLIRPPTQTQNDSRQLTLKLNAA